jgi:fatty-acyl-CoA synthase
VDNPSTNPARSGTDAERSGNPGELLWAYCIVGPMPFPDRLRELRRAAERSLWRIQTVGRVGKKLGVHKNMTWPGARLLLRDLPKGKGNPSLIFHFHAANSPDHPALIQATVPGELSLPASSSPLPASPLPGSGKTYSYREVNASIDRIGLALSRRGLGRGASALIFLKNRIEFLLIQPGVCRIGGSAVPASWRSTVPEIAYLAQHSGVQAIFFDVDIADTIREAIPLLPLVPRENLISVGGEAPGFVSLSELMATVSGEAPDRSEESGLVMYTSGTTGKPKGARRGFQRDVLPGALAFIGETPMALGEIHLSACPIYHATALGFTSFACLLGGTAVMLADFKPELFLSMVQRYRVTSTALVPTMIHRIVELGKEVIGKYDLSSLKAIFSGGAPLSGPLAIEAMDLLGDKIWNFYGATETGSVTLASPSDLRASPGTIGRPLPGVDIRLINEQGRDCAVGEVGELFAKGPMLIDGYHADPEATRKSMLDGYFSVGDLARVDAHGCFHIEGRKRDMIISGGVNVYPAEIEAALHEHPAVAEVAVVGVPDREWGERVRAFVVRRPGADITAEALKEYCRPRLAGPKLPRDYIFLPGLPRNPTGKVLKRDLRTMEIG